MNTTINFYKSVPILKNLSSVSTNSDYVNVPEDWYLLLTDVTKSTQAINQGQYKNVNMLGALSIISILNIDKQLDLPFIFGGDGAFVLIPKDILNESKQALLAVQNIAEQSYNLNLRIAAIPVKDIYQHNQKLLIAKIEISKEYNQAIIKGGGLEFADKLLKEKLELYKIDDKIDPLFNADFNGLECRWEAIPSPKDETISLLIKCFDEGYYNTVFQNLDLILGSNNSRSPISKENLTLSQDSKELQSEASIYANNLLMKYFYILKYKSINLLGQFLMKYNIFQWGGYKKRVANSCDTEKFDDMIKMVISTSYEQTKQLEEYLNNEFKQKNLCYGIHKTDAALMTCLVFEKHGKHIHFVDSIDGGYAMAAIGLKNQLNQKNL